jgi:hypothetical protein
VAKQLTTLTRDPNECFLFAEANNIFLQDE